MARRNSSGSSRDVSAPSTRIRPDDGSISRFVILRVVLLPQPEEPISTHTSPDAISRLKRSTAGTAEPAKYLLTSSRRITGEPPRLPLPGSELQQRVRADG